MNQQSYLIGGRLGGNGPRRECVACGVHTCRAGRCKNCGGRTELIASAQPTATVVAPAVLTVSVAS